MAMETGTARDEILELIAGARGDEKHDASSFSTLDVPQVLYEVLRVDPARPAWEGRDRFLLSKGHGPLAYYAVLAHNGFFPGDELESLHDVGGDPRRAPGPPPGPGRRGLDRLARARTAD